jgi:hypothetical protein
MTERRLHKIIFYKEIRRESDMVTEKRMCGFDTFEILCFIWDGITQY